MDDRGVRSWPRPARGDRAAWPRGKRWWPSINAPVEGRSDVPTGRTRPSLTSSTAPSRIVYTGIQYTPVLSMPTCVQALAAATLAGLPGLARASLPAPPCVHARGADRRVTASRPIDLAEIGASASIDPVIASGGSRCRHPRYEAIIQTGSAGVAAAVSYPPHLYGFHVLRLTRPADNLPHLTYTAITYTALTYPAFVTCPPHCGPAGPSVAGPHRRWPPPSLATPASLTIALLRRRRGHRCNRSHGGACGQAHDQPPGARNTAGR